MNAAGGENFPNFPPQKTLLQAHGVAMPPGSKPAPNPRGSVQGLGEMRGTSQLVLSRIKTPKDPLPMSLMTLINLMKPLGGRKAGMCWGRRSLSPKGQR